jgi:hypothetical protein
MKETPQTEEEIFQRFLTYEPYDRIARDNRVTPERIRQIIVKQQQRIAREKEESITMAKFEAGQRVSIADAEYEGEMATVENYPGTDTCVCDHGYVNVRFDNDGVVKGHAVLTPQSFEPEKLRLL